MKLLLALILSAFLISSCKQKLPIVDDLSARSWILTDQDSTDALFPDYLKGKPFVAGYIFTNCPDICPLTTNNMHLIQEQLSSERINDVGFASISFDPAADRPHVLKKFAEVRKLDLSNWRFFTGSDSTISSLMNAVRVFYTPGDSTVFPDGRKIYYFIHTDRISLFDGYGRIRKNYRGSKVNIEEVVNDIKSLLEK